jgi:prepilin-type N-terminal cleavage/methylation domain-containing protein/prepilin-type processing-associated H-X9-DG protein
MMKFRGFTLVELLVVIAIIAVLAGIAYPVTTSYVAKSREAACLNQLRALGVGLQSYLQDHGNVMPTMEAGRSSRGQDVEAIDKVLLPYVDGENAFKCPADNKLFAESGSSYLWNSTQNGRHASKLNFFGNQDRPDKIPLITDKESWHQERVNFLYADLSISNKQRFVAGN